MSIKKFKITFDHVQTTTISIILEGENKEEVLEYFSNMSMDCIDRRAKESESLESSIENVHCQEVE